MNTVLIDSPGPRASMVAWWWWSWSSPCPPTWPSDWRDGGGGGGGVGWEGGGDIRVNARQHQTRRRSVHRVPGWSATAHISTLVCGDSHQVQVRRRLACLFLREARQHGLQPHTVVVGPPREQHGGSQLAVEASRVRSMTPSTNAARCRVAKCSRRVDPPLSGSASIPHFRANGGGGGGQDLNTYATAMRPRNSAAG